MLRWFACQCAATVRVTVLPVQGGRFARPSTRSAYTYTPSGSSPAQLASPCFGPFRYRPEPWPRMAPLVEFGAVLGGSASLPLPAPPLPSSSRRYAPQCFVGEYTSSPCDVSHRASDEPRRRMSLSSALAPSSLASPFRRRVSLRSIYARRLIVGSLNLARVSPRAKQSRRRRAQCGVQIRRAALVGAHLRGARFPAGNPPRFRPHHNLISPRFDFLILLFDGERENVV